MTITIYRSERVSRVSGIITVPLMEGNTFLRAFVDIA